MLRLAHTQVEEGHRITILTGRDRAEDDVLWQEDVVDGIRVLRLRPVRRDLENAILNRDADALFNRLREERIDLLHVHHWHNTTGDVIARATGLGIPCVVTMHDYFAVCPWFFRLRNDRICDPAVSRETCVACTAAQTEEDPDRVREVLASRETVYRSELSKARARFALSENQAAYLRDVPMLQGLTFDVAPLPEPDLSPVAMSVSAFAQGTGADSLRIVSWGGLVRGKGMHVLLEACESLSRPVEVHHFGRTLDIEYLDLLHRIARQTKFVSHGAFDRATMTRAFGRYDVAVFPSLFRETFGFVVDEAILLGLPVVVSDRGAPSERIGERGVTFPGGDAGALARTLQGFLDEPSTLATHRDAERTAGTSMADHWSHLQAVYQDVTRH